ncbi:haloacid dehalogenase-like hydrolase domain-containing protein 3 [Aphomia sociella]
MGLQHLKLVTFDVTNTLLKFRVPPWQYYTVVAREHGFEGTEEDVKSRFLDSYNVMWKKHPNFGKCTIAWDKWWRQVVKRTFEGRLPVSSDANVIADTLIEEFKTTKCWCAMEGSEKILNLLQKKGISIGVISNFDPRLYDILHNIGLIDKFDFIITSYEFGHSKPDEKIFKHALERSNRCPKASESLHIGDDVKKDYEGARLAGWHAVLVTKNIQTEKPPAPNHVFDSLDKLYLALEKDRLVL